MVLVDGQLAEDSVVIRNYLIEIPPVVNIYFGATVVRVVLRFQDYSLLCVFPLNSTLEVVARGFNSVLNWIFFDT